MTTSASRNFDLNGLVRISLEAAPRYCSYFDNEYQRISSDHLAEGAPVVTLKIVEKLLRDDTREIHYKDLFRFRFAAYDLDTSHPTIEFESHWLDRFYTTAVGAFVQGQLLEPVIYLMLLRSDVLFMHAAGVSKNGKGFVFPAHGGTGKTTLSLALMRMGFDLMGDDLMMVEAKTGVVHPYARPLHLFNYNLKTLKVPLGVRAAIGLKDVIRTAIALVTGKKFLISTRAHADEIMDVQMGKPSQLAAVVFLKREGAEESFDLSDPVAMEQAAAMVIKSADLNTSLEEHFGAQADIAKLEASVVKSVLKHVPNMSAINARLMKDNADRAEFAEAYLGKL
ncbi:MAG: hypothetical protein ABJH26_13175, partial [Marinomonas sp.]